MKNEDELFLSVDIESSGPSTRLHSMLSLGICNTEDLEQNLYIEYKPNSLIVVKEAMEVNGLSLDELIKTDMEPKEGMELLESWIKGVQHQSRLRPVMAAFNAPYDWSFVKEYFEFYLGRNPFGISCLDIKALYMGKFNTKWTDTSKTRLDKRFKPPVPHTHNALDDAIEQAMWLNNIADYPSHTL